MGQAKHLPIPGGMFGEITRTMPVDWTYEKVVAALAEYIRSLPAGVCADRRDDPPQGYREHFDS